MTQFDDAVGVIVGGLVGISYPGGSIEFAYASGTVSGETYVGGLLGGGFGGGSGTTISNAYSTGDVTGQENVGGIDG